VSGEGIEFGAAKWGEEIQSNEGRRGNPIIHEEGLSMKKIVFLFIAFLVFSSSVPGAFAQTKPAEFSYSIFFPATHKHTVLAGEWAKEIEKRTGGRVKITLFPGGTLTPAPTCYDGVVKGISDIGMSVLAYTKGKFPLTEVIDLPLGYANGTAATSLVNQYYSKFKPKEFEEVKILYLHAHGPGILHSKKAVSKLEELKGLRVRCTGTVTEIVKALGGVPVSMPMGETYDALNRGMVEGSMAPMESMEGWKWGEVVKFTTESFGSAYSTAFFVAMNKEKWNALPAEIQKTIETINAEWAEKTGKLWDEVDKSGKAFSLKLGNKIIPLSKEENQRWATAVRPVLEGYVKRMKEKGLPGEEALKFCMEGLKKK
jgi:TRAP-type transport system periplasmic protein